MPDDARTVRFASLLACLSLCGCWEPDEGWLSGPFGTFTEVCVTTDAGTCCVVEPDGPDCSLGCQAANRPPERCARCRPEVVAANEELRRGLREPFSPPPNPEPDAGWHDVEYCGPATYKPYHYPR